MPNVIKDIFWKVVKKYKKRTIQNSDVSLEEFSFNLNNYLKRCELCRVGKVIIIKIPKPGSNMIYKNEGIFSSIQLYNKLIDSVKFDGELNIIDPLGDAVDSDYLTDGYHLNRNGFNKVFNNLDLTLK